MATESAQPARGINDSTSSCLIITELVLRVCVGFFTLISLCIIGSAPDFDLEAAFNYLLAAAVLSFLYSGAQIVFVGIHVGKCWTILRANACYIYFTISADLVCCLLLISGTAAAFGKTTDDDPSVYDKLKGLATGSAVLALIAFIVMIPLMVLSGRRVCRPRLS
ncbi:hypothetical protein GOP47_0009206 [Adiantum capillus-veneris]|uniref:CASP-like protein n=1 Tax=Adiantum capillus-veneris TaxID=13818 RepID=A0A9D4ZJF7_ADICA|nr:hypothetical protein GOP47_0009206 [Adiantum capillus-veneris]